MLIPAYCLFYIQPFQLNNCVVPMDTECHCVIHYIVYQYCSTTATADNKVVISNTATVLAVCRLVKANLTRRSVVKGCVLIIVHFPFSVFFSIYIIAEISRKIKFWSCVEIIRGWRRLAVRNNRRVKFCLHRANCVPLVRIWHRPKDLNLNQRFWRSSCYRYTRPIYGVPSGTRTRG